jgi:hypothetical protein
MYSKPVHKPHQPSKPVSSTQKQFGGEAEMYEYKAKKYHYKCQQKLKEIMQNGGKCPAGYERYLKPYA